MRFANRTPPAAPARAVGRNDPCPCGSGRKFKHCCASRPPAPPAAPAAAAPAGPAQVRMLRDAGRFLEALRLAEDHVRAAPADAAGRLELGLVHLHAARPAQALPALMQAVRLDPRSAEAHYHAGLALLLLGRSAEAITAFRTVIGLAPDHADALERLGNLLQMQERVEEARALFARVAAAVPDTIAGRLNRAKVLQIDGDLAAAEEVLRDSVARLPFHAETRRALAAILREQGRFEEAVPLLEQATGGTPAEAATAYFDLVHSKRLTADDAPMVAQMRALLDYGPLPEQMRQAVHFALGKAHDDLGDHAEAMRHFDAGNAIAARHRPFDRAQFGASVQRVIAATEAGTLAAEPAPGPISELPVLVLGMPRSGTTLVEQILSSHPAVAAGGELPFWNRAAEGLGRRPAGETPDAYIARMAGEYEATLRRIGPQALRVTDKTPGNYLWLGMFRLAFPRGRIVHCRRHPLDTCLSNYFTNFVGPLNFTNDKADLAFYYRTYRRMMAHWRAVLPPECLFEIDYEELVEDPAPMTRRLIDFLGLDWDDACLRPEANRRAIRTASQWQARQPTYRSSRERWRNYEPWLGALRDLLADPDGGGPVNPQSENPAIPRARRLREEGRLDEAIAAIQAALRADLNDPVLYSELGTHFLAAGQPPEAAECFERAIGLVPAFATAHYNLGAALERQGRIAEAKASLRRAIALAPDLGAAYSRLGNLLQAEGAQAEALDCFRRASTLLPNPADQELEEAKLLRVDGSHAAAEAKLRRVIALDPANPLAHAMLGDVLGEAGRFAEAIEHLRRAGDLDPERVSVLYNMAIFQRVTEAERPLLAQMEGLLARPARPEFERSLLHFALGKSYDDLGDPARAIAHFDAGNAIEHARQPFDRAAFAAEIDRLIAAFPPAALAGAAAGPADDRPLFVLGMPRSGTTLIEQILSAHPAIAAGGEIGYWTDTAAPDASDYLALLDRIGPGAARVTDKNPFNFLAIGRIRAALPRARFIHCRRDPLDTCLSIYFTRFATAQPFAYDRGDLAFFYGQYRRLMAHWRATLPPGCLLEVEYETLTAAPEAETRRLVGFAGLEWDDACLTPENNSGFIRTASLWQARQKVNRRSVARWQRYAPYLGELQALRPDAA